MTQGIRPTGAVGKRRSVDRQVVLPFGKSVEISYKSIKVRFFRSMITTMSLILAVSFLSFVRVSTDVADGLLSTGRPELRNTLIKAGYDLSPEDRTAGSSPKQRWIIILSLLVCTVGIVNAQLMAVTERFREIGTMKCLGALDRFILKLFLLEAGMQGLVGALIGAVGWSACFLALVPGSFRVHIPVVPVLAGCGRVPGPVHSGRGRPQPVRRPVPGHRGRQDAAGRSHAGRTVNGGRKY